MIRTTRWSGGGRLGAAVALIVMMASGVAQARQAPGDDLIGIANRAVAQTGATREASGVLFPKVAAMAPVPVEFLWVRELSLLTTASPEWAALAAWAAAPAQQEVLTALETITDPRGRYVLGFPYGRGRVEPAWSGAGLRVDLGSPELLARAVTGMDYLEALDRVGALCTVEAQRRAAEGNGAEALDALVAWMRLGRMVADRLFFAEKRWGMQTMAEAAERLLDIAHEHAALFTPDDMSDAVTELDLRSLALERIQFPDGERLALIELVGRTMEPRRGPTETGFAPTLGLLRGGGLRAFDGAAYWARLQEEHAGWFDTIDMVRDIFGDWGQRWQVNNIFDPIMSSPTDYSKMDPKGFAMVHEVVGGMEELFALRVELLVAVTGTRSALGVVGYRARHGVWPPALSAVQPQFVRQLDFDPWNYDRARETRGIFQFFIPMRERRAGPREEPRPHRMRVRFGGEALSPSQTILASVLGEEQRSMLRRAFEEGLDASLMDPETGRVNAERLKEASIANINALPDLTEEQKRAMVAAVQSMNQSMVESLFEMLRAVVGMAGDTEVWTVELRDDSFVLYSIGPDQLPGFAQVVGMGGEDILIWPPLLTLERRYRAETGGSGGSATGGSESGGE